MSGDPLVCRCGLPKRHDQVMCDVCRAADDSQIPEVFPDDDQPARNEAEGAD